jgi:hypothetical protein
MTTSQYGPPFPAAYQPQPVKKKKRVFMWFFLAVQVLFVIWVIAGAASGHHATDCGTLDAKTCQDAADAGTAIGVGLVVGLWVAVDFILGITWAVVRFARRGAN